MRARLQNKSQVDADSFFIESQLLFEDNQFRQAIFIINKAIKLKPKNADYIHFKAILLTKLSYFERALLFYEKSLSLNPNYIDCLINKSNVLSFICRYDEALATIKQALSILEKGTEKTTPEIQKILLERKEFILRKMQGKNDLNSTGDEAATGSADDNQTHEDYKEIDVPNDDNCLLWAAIFALLLPHMNLVNNFNKMYETIFGTENFCLNNGEEIQVNSPEIKKRVYQLMLKYNFKKNTPKEFKDNILEILVCHIFRNRIVDKMDKVLDKNSKLAIVTESGRESWIKYMECMREPTAWCGDPEIYAINQLTGVNIYVLRERLSPLKYKVDKANETIYLVHTNAQGQGKENHYHYKLQNKLVLEHIKCPKKYTGQFFESKVEQKSRVKENSYGEFLHRK
jgi:tetratricopeptide (TPR) repeat protein